MDSPAFILTTEGPVRILSIAAEDPAVRSVICIDGGSEALPVSPAYDSFVRRPTGLIERITGHGAYRMDVSGRVDDGRSWQLAVYLAHVAARQQVPGRVFFATGEVDSAGRIRPVEHTARKLASLAAALPTLGIDAAGALILVPAGTDALPAEVAGVAVHPIDDVAEALTLLGLERPPAETSPATAARGRARLNGRMILGLGLAVAVVAGGLFWVGVDLARWEAMLERGQLLDLETELDRAAESTSGAVRVRLFESMLAARRPDLATIRIEGTLILADRPDACRDPDQQRRTPLETPPPPGAVLCVVEMRALAGDPAMAVFGRMAYWPDGLGQGGKPARTMRGSEEQAGRTWRLPFKEYPGAGAALRLVVIAGATPASGAQPWYTELLGQPADSAAFAVQRARLARLGYVVVATDWVRP